MFLITGLVRGDGKHFNGLTLISWQLVLTWYATIIDVLTECKFAKYQAIANTHIYKY